jgi:hypothetical protein
MVLKDRLKQINNSNSELDQIDLIKSVNLLSFILLSIILAGLTAQLPWFHFYISRQLILVSNGITFLKESGFAIEHPYFFNSIQMVLIYSALLAIIFPIQIFLWLITRWLSKISKIPSFALEQLLILEAITFWLVFLLATTGINLFPFSSLGSP